MNKEQIEKTIKENYGNEVLESMQDITGSINDVLSQINKMLSTKYLEKLGAECYYTAFACTLKTAFCDFFMEAMKNRPSKEIILNTNTLLQDAREYIFNKLEKEKSND